MRRSLHGILLAVLLFAIGYMIRLGFPEDENILENAGFESGAPSGTGFNFDNWSELNINNVDRFLRADTYAAALTNDGAAPGALSQTISNPTPGAYLLRFWTHGDGSVAGQFDVYDATASDNLVDRNSTGVEGTAWSVVETYFVVPPTCLTMYVRFWAPIGGVGEGFFDAAELIGLGTGEKEKT